MNKENKMEQELKNEKQEQKSFEWKPLNENPELNPKIRPGGLENKN